MRIHYFSVLLLTIGLLLSFGGKKTGVQKEMTVKETSTNEKSDWVQIFNGKDLEGWTMKISSYPLGENFGNTFRVENGILKVRYDGYGSDLKDRFGTLYFDRSLSNYRIKVEYRFVGETAAGAPKWGCRDSGIQFHGQPPSTQKLNQPFPICLEYNFHGGNGTDERPLGAMCANGMFVEVNGEKNTTTCVPAIVSKTFHGNQWVTAEIDVKDGKITHFVNGEEILTYTNPTYDTNNETSKTLMLGGDVSLQSNSHPIDFKKIELLEY